MSDGITIKKYDEKFFVFEDEKEISVIVDTIEFCLPEKFRGKIIEDKDKNFPFHYNLTALSNKINPKSENLNQEIVQSSSFNPPLFGITGLPSPYNDGNQEYNSNGLLIWINGR